MQGDLISRSAVLNSIEDWMDDGTGDEFDRGYDFAMRRAMRIICNAPAVDAVPVVRCKDCRYSESMKKHGVSKFGENALNCTMCRGDDGYGYTGISVIHPDDYCSDGALKDGDAE